ncbi:MAG: hypothetical protein AAGF23_22820 [Acidobacteriota bacterium]
MDERNPTGACLHTETPIEMFRELVDGALANRQLTPSEESAFYLVNLLDGFVRPAGPYADLGAPPDQALCEILLHAARSSGVKRFALFRLTGDLALFLTGFFADALEARHVTPDYYRQLGETAYAQAADCARPQTRGEVFEELAENFAPFSGVLNAVSERCSLLDAGQLLRLYERYSATGNAADAERLLQGGVSSSLRGDGLVH